MSSNSSVTSVKEEPADDCDGDDATSVRRSNRDRKTGRPLKYIDLDSSNESPPKKRGRPSMKKDPDFTDVTSDDGSDDANLSTMSFDVWKKEKSRKTRDCSDNIGPFPLGILY